MNSIGGIEKRISLDKIRFSFSTDPEHKQQQSEISPLINLIATQPNCLKFKVHCESFFYDGKALIGEYSKTVEPK